VRVALGTKISFQTPLTFRVEASHVLGFVRIEGPDLDLMAEHGVRVLLKEHLVDCHVHGGDDFLWVADQLAVQVLIKQPVDNIPNFSLSFMFRLNNHFPPAFAA